MRIGELKSKASDLMILSKDILRSFEGREEVLNANIKYWLKTGNLIALKKGFYVIKERYDREPNKDLYLEYLANKLVRPSYLSVEYVLAKYQLLSEPVNAITSVTSKLTRELYNPLGTFRYYSVSRELFIGYQIKYLFDAPVLEASKEKALFDFLYLRFIKGRPTTLAEIENLRINWEVLSRKDFKKVKSYATFTKNPRIKAVLKLIEKTYYGSGS